MKVIRNVVPYMTPVHVYATGLTLKYESLKDVRHEVLTPLVTK